MEPAPTSTKFVIIIKPDAVARKLELDIVRDFADQGFIIGRHQDIPPGDRRWRQHYAEHAEKPHYEALCSEMMERPAICFEADVGSVDSVNIADRLQFTRALTLCLREKYVDLNLPVAQRRRHNSIHCSDSIDGALYEWELWWL